MENYEKCRFGILVSDDINCGNTASEYYLEVVSDDISICVGCKSYFSCIDSDNLCNSDESTEGLSYEG